MLHSLPCGVHIGSRCESSVLCFLDILLVYLCVPSLSCISVAASMPLLSHVELMCSLDDAANSKSLDSRITASACCVWPG